jgi:hypothetical protein
MINADRIDWNQNDVVTISNTHASRNWLPLDRHAYVVRRAQAIDVFWPEAGTLQMLNLESCL